MMKKNLLLSNFLLCVLGISLCLGSPAYGEEPEYLALDSLLPGQLNQGLDQCRSDIIHFKGQFHMVSNVFGPFYTVFEESNFINFAAWAFDAPLWKKDTYKNDFPFLYIDRTDFRLVKQLKSLKKFDRFEATGELGSSFGDYAWIKVTSLKPIPYKMSRYAIAHMARAYAWLEEDDFMNGLINFSLASSETLPHSVRALIQKEEGTCLYMLGSYTEAAEAFNVALDLLDDDKDPEIEGMLKETLAMVEWEEEEMDRAASEEESPEYEEYGDYPDGEEEDSIEVVPVGTN